MLFLCVCSKINISFIEKEKQLLKFSLVVEVLVLLLFII